MAPLMGRDAGAFIPVDLWGLRGGGQQRSCTGSPRSSEVMDRDMGAVSTTLTV